MLQKIIYSLVLFNCACTNETTYLKEEITGLEEKLRYKERVCRQWQELAEEEEHHYASVFDKKIGPDNRELFRQLSRDCPYYFLDLRKELTEKEKSLQKIIED